MYKSANELHPNLSLWACADCRAPPFLGLCAMAEKENSVEVNALLTSTESKEKLGKMHTVIILITV